MHSEVLPAPVVAGCSRRCDTVNAITISGQQGRKCMKRKRIVGLVAVVGLVAASFVGQSAPAQADPGVGGVAFAGIARLDRFPCDPGPCNGSLDGVAVGTGGAVNSTGTLVAAAFAPTPTNLFNLTAKFSYNEPSAVPPCPLQGSASGTFDVTAGVGISPTPGATASAHGDFTWTRRGLLATIDTSVDVTVGTKTANDIPDTAVAVFVPIPSVPPPLCSAPQPVTALVLGVDALTPVDLPPV
jgi:hypothetical protein